MAVDRMRQEVLNVLLAQVLDERGVGSVPETIIKHGANQTRHMPDVLVRYMGLRVALEGEVGDQSDALARAMNSARARVEEGLAHIGVAVVYPKEIRVHELGADLTEAKRALARAQLEIAVVSEAGEEGPRFCTVDQLEVMLRHVFEQLVKENAVEEAARLLAGAIEVFSNHVVTRPGTTQRLKRTLGVGKVKETA